MSSKTLDPEVYARRTAVWFSLLGVMPLAVSTEMYFLFGTPFANAKAADELDAMKGELARLKQEKENAPNDTISMQVTEVTKRTYDYTTGQGIASDIVTADTVAVTHTGLIADQVEKITSYQPPIAVKDLVCGVGAAIATAWLGIKIVDKFAENLGMLRAKLGGNSHMQQAFAKRADQRRKSPV